MKEILSSRKRLTPYKNNDLDIIIAPFGFGGTDNLAQEGAHGLFNDGDLIKNLNSLGQRVSIIDPPSLGPFEVQEENFQIRNIDALTSVNTWLCDTIADSKEKQHIPITLGGDASLSIGSIAGIHKYTKTKNLKFATLWLSNHFGNSSPRVTKSWNANRMAFRAVTFDDMSRNNLHQDFRRLISFKDVNNPIQKLDEVIHVGINHRSAQEIPESHQFFSMEDVDDIGIKNIIDHVLKQLQNYDLIHVVWDLNSLNISGVSNYALGQLSYREAMIIAREIDKVLRRSNKLSSIDFVEHCPSREAWDKRGEAAEWIQDIANAIFGGHIFNVPRKY